VNTVDQWPGIITVITEPAYIALPPHWNLEVCLHVIWYSCHFESVFWSIFHSVPFHVLVLFMFLDFLATFKGLTLFSLLRVVWHGNGITMQECSLRTFLNITTTTLCYSFVMNMFISACTYKHIFVETPTLSSSRSPWWSSNTRTKPAFTDQLRNSPMFDRKCVHKWGQCYSTLKGQTQGEVLRNTAVYAVANLCQSILTMKFLEDKKSKGRSLLT